MILERLPEAIEIVRERLPVELYYVVERTIQESVGERKLSENAAPDLIGLSDKMEQANTLLSLLSGLFAKLDTIIIGHKFVLEFVVQKESSNNFFSVTAYQEILVYSIREVWSTVQNEVKALLYDYLTSPDRMSGFSNVVVSMNEILKERKPKGKEKAKKVSFFFQARNVISYELLKQLYRIGGAVQNTATQEMYKATWENIDTLSMIGFGQIAGDVKDESHIGHSIGIIDKYANVVAAGHRLLVNPDPYNVLLAYKPTIAFSDKVEDSILLR
ncbi:hypothetical protein HK101_005648 [Irineochytrium annulatum]|nr:hypothetical protein HK101_005648 [Irineochytrium annulatum]